MALSNKDGTTVVPVSAEVRGSPALKARLAVREMSADSWIDAHASGTLRKNKRLGFAWRDQYLRERTAFEFGWAFICVPRTRVEWGTPITEGDNSAITEAGWHIDRMLALWPYPEDYFEVKHLTIELEGKTARGIGLIVRSTSASWVPAGNIICGVIAEYDDAKGWLEATPC